MNKFNGKHLMFFIWATSIVSIKTYPSLYISLGKRDSWIAMTFAGICLFLFAYTIFSICEKHNAYNIHEIYLKVLGNFFGKIFLYLFALTIIFTLIECSSIEANAMHVNILPFTPSWFFVLFFALPAIYTITRGTHSIGIVTIVSITLIIISGTILAILTQKYKHLGLILPVLNNGITLNLFLSSIRSLSMFGGFALCLPLLENFQHSKSLKIYVAVALLFAIQMEVFSSAGIVCTFAEKEAASLFYPKLIQTQLVNYFQFIESGELHVLLQVIGGWFIKYVIAFLSLITLLKNLNFYNNKLVYIISILVVLASCILSSSTYFLFKALSIYTYIELANFIIIPFIIYIIFHFKSSKKT